MWELLVKRVIVFGMDSANTGTNTFRLTEFGKKMVEAGVPQPYDPDGFIEHFERNVADVDPTVKEYVVEAVQCFNAGCSKASAVMIGCASEKLLHLLCDAVAGYIPDGDQRMKFKGDVSDRISIMQKYKKLRVQLDHFVRHKQLPPELVDSINIELPSGFEMLRRARNGAGHPAGPPAVDDDTVFLNIRAFTEYAARTNALIQYFNRNTAPGEEAPKAQLT
jgi:hypothetical protein